MIALDTNVVVRILTRDEPVQVQRAVELFASGALWLPKTVLLETEWVLRSAYSLPAETILEGFRHLLGYPPLEMEDHADVLRALRWYEQGLDLAAALHLASIGPAQRFATFDDSLARQAAGLEDTPPTDRI